MTESLAQKALAIWQAGVDGVRPDVLIRRVLSNPASRLWEDIRCCRRIIVIGAGKAGTPMSAAVEEVLSDQLDKLTGWVNVPGGTARPLQRIHLHEARPIGSNHPTREGVEGTKRILQLVQSAGTEDVVLCLLSGGGSALLPAPVNGLTLEDKQQLTRLLHASGATIQEMNTVRKHLSECKGGRLAQAFRGKHLYSLIISDVIGDPLDVIASGPTAPDPTTFADALHVLEKYRLTTETNEAVPTFAAQYLREGKDGHHPETLKYAPENVSNLIIGNNQTALRAAEAKAKQLGYSVLNLGAFLEGETQEVARVLVGLLRSIRQDGVPVAAPVCLLSGGETTVTLQPGYGRGGRNQEFTLACLCLLRPDELCGNVILSGGTDGEDGPTDAAGAYVDETVLVRARDRGLTPEPFLHRHDAYSFFDEVGGLIKTGLTQTNVMDLRVMLLERSSPRGTC